MSHIAHLSFTSHLSSVLTTVNYRAVLVPVLGTCIPSIILLLYKISKIKRGGRGEGKIDGKRNGKH